jgi:hypothetical protein
MDIFDSSMGEMAENWEENLSSPSKNDKLEDFLALYKDQLSDSEIDLATRALNGQTNTDESISFNNLVDRLEGKENVLEFPNKNVQSQNQNVADDLSVSQNSAFREVFTPNGANQLKTNAQSTPSNTTISQNGQTDNLIKLCIGLFVAYMVYKTFFESKE